MTSSATDRGRIVLC